jgi:aerobic carbon-monoxide dehydrogenase medium subunit
MQDFAYRRPSSLKEAVAALKAAPEAKLLAGGMSLVPILKLGLANPSELVSLRKVPELRGINVADGRVSVGAASTHAQVAASAVVRETIPALARLAEGIGDPQVRNRGTLGGSIAHADPAADYPPALVALGATIQTDRRQIAAQDFFKGMFETALAPDEIVVSVSFPVPEKAAYAKFPNPASLFAVVGVFVARTKGKGVQVAVTGAGPAVFRVAAMEQALGSKFSVDALSGVSVATDGLVNDPSASAEYRAHLIGVMAKRAVAACA